MQWGIANSHRSALQTVMGGCQLPICLGLLLQWGIANLHRFAFAMGDCQFAQVCFCNGGLPICSGLLLQWGIANLHRSALQTVMGGCQLPICLDLLLQWEIANLLRSAFAMGDCQFA